MSRWFWSVLLALCTPLAWADPSPSALDHRALVILTPRSIPGYRLDARFDALVLMMTVRTRPLLRRHGAQEERAGDADAEFRHHLPGDPPVVRHRYSLAFTPGTPYIGAEPPVHERVIYIKDVAAGGGHQGHAGRRGRYRQGIGESSGGHDPETVYAMFQLTFAIITQP